MASDSSENEYENGMEEEEEVDEMDDAEVSVDWMVRIRKKWCLF